MFSQVLSDPPQLELVYTLENTSDSVTRWAEGHLGVLRDETSEVWTEPNSGLLVQEPSGFGQSQMGGSFFRSWAVFIGFPEKQPRCLLWVDPPPPYGVVFVRLRFEPPKKGVPSIKDRPTSQFAEKHHTFVAVCIPKLAVLLALALGQTLSLGTRPHSVFLPPQGTSLPFAE